MESANQDFAIGCPVGGAHCNFLYRWLWLEDALRDEKSSCVLFFGWWEVSQERLCGEPWLEEHTVTVSAAQDLRPRVGRQLWGCTWISCLVDMVSCSISACLVPKSTECYRDVKLILYKACQKLCLSRDRFHCHKVRRYRRLGANVTRSPMKDV